ncbi:MAG: 30S ribosomal protein S17e [Candidatus Woesearchaeota archaeon]
MGRIKTQLIKRWTHKLIATHREKFTQDFNKNKLLVEQLIDVPNKRIRNVIAGYVTNLLKRGEE